MLPLETRNHFVETVEGGRQAHVPHALDDAPKPSPLRSNLKHALMEGVEGQGLVEVKHATYNICAVTHVPLFHGVGVCGKFSADYLSGDVTVSWQPEG